MRCHHDEPFDPIARMGKQTSATPLLNIAWGLQHLRCAQCNAQTTWLYVIPERNRGKEQ